MGKVFYNPYGRKELIRDAMTYWTTYSERYRDVLSLVDATLQGKDRSYSLRGLNKADLYDLPRIRFLMEETRVEAHMYLDALDDCAIRAIIRNINNLAYDYTYNTVKGRLTDSNYTRKKYPKYKYGVDPASRTPTVARPMRKGTTEA